MNENNPNPATPIPQAEVNLIQALFGSIKSGIDGSLDLVKDCVVQHFVGQEKQKRVELIIGGLTAHRETTRNLNKVKPDQESYNENDQPGKPSVRNYSKAKIEERAKLQQQLKRIEEALNLALTKSDFSKLANIKANPNSTEEKPDATAAE